MKATAYRGGRASKPVSSARGDGSLGDPGRIEAKRLLRALGAYPKRSLGQHFLVSSSILDRIVLMANVVDGERVLEIGPGLGFLTRRLLAAGAWVTALEKDDRFAAHLRACYEGEERLTLLHGDALSWPLEDLTQGPSRVRVVANLPYNVSVPIVFRLLEVSPPCADLHLMVQKEVAMRMMASPGTSAYGALSVGVQRLADVSSVLHVPPRAFYPPPEVDSTVVRLVPHRRIVLGDKEAKAFRRVVRAAFGARRKTLINALRASGYDRGRIRAGIERCRIDGRRRGETLSVEEFVALARALHGVPGVGEDS